MELSRAAEHSPTRIYDEPRDAAVLVPIIHRDNRPFLLFTKRSEDLGKHPGQMSFPGGGRELIDDSLYDTAVREANEEINLNPNEVSPIGQLDDIRTISGYSVTPFVAEIPDREYHPDEREVAEITNLPIAALTDPSNYEAEPRSSPKYGDTVIHYFHVNGFTVWGATGRILVQFLELSTDWTVPELSDPAYTD
jgi:8-oxo-dGTP pyrophosphatase MutT (NUDIX family)